MGKRKKQTLILSQPKTLEPIVTKFERRDYVVDPYHQKLALIRTGVFAPHIGVYEVHTFFKRIFTAAKISNLNCIYLYQQKG